MILENSDTVTFISTSDKKIILVRAILSAISLCCCLFLMIIYLIYCLQQKLQICVKKMEEEDILNNNEYPEDLYENEEEKPKKEIKEKPKKKKEKIGLGSTYMFLLTISNFFASLLEFLFYFYYVNEIQGYADNLVEKQREIYNKMNNNDTCFLFGFFHNCFDLLSVCWTTMLALLFFDSTKLNSEMSLKPNKYLKIGFLYSIICCLIFCGLPLITNSYGFARFYCTFKYDEFNEKGDYIGETNLTKGWRYSFAAFIAINSIVTVIWFFKQYYNFSKQLELKKLDPNYKIYSHYARIYKIFPIALIISRYFRGLSRSMIVSFYLSEPFRNFLEYINAFIFAGRGIFDSIVCIFFFRGVFWCCANNNKQGKLSIGKEIIDNKGEKVTFYTF